MHRTMKSDVSHRSIVKLQKVYGFCMYMVLVNESPSNEFQFHCGLKQDDPLSPYLFIFVMESLHLSFSSAVDEGLFTEAAASSIGCSIMLNQFRYLGVMVGECMSRHKAWVDVVLKLRSRLSKWKAKTLSIGGRLTLLKSVLGASRLYSMSIFTVPRDGSLWFRVIQALYGPMIDMHSVHKASSWCSIMREGDRTLRDAFPRMFVLESVKQIFVAEKMVMPVDYSFRRPVRGGDEQQQFTDLASTMDSVSLSSSHDRWVCNLSGDGEFRVKEVRNFINDLFLPSHPEPTRWVKYIPIKINIFAWRARRDCLPTMVNLIRRGVTLESSNCPLCLSCEEDVHHVFFQCDLAWVVLRRVCRWWDLDWQLWSSFSDWYSWFSLIRLSSKVKSLLEGVFCVAWWSIWILRNRTIFDDNPPTRSVILDDIVSFYFHWCRNRCKRLFSWEAWPKNPYFISL
nr:RNA-directed DNA polymerase, eukaryota [Tanacetum cinerariifolium]